MCSHAKNGTDESGVGIRLYSIFAVLFYKIGKNFVVLQDRKKSLYTVMRELSCELAAVWNTQSGDVCNDPHYGPERMHRPLNCFGIKGTAQLALHNFAAAAAGATTVGSA